MADTKPTEPRNPAKVSQELSRDSEPINEQPEPVTAVADAIAETQEKIAEHVETPVQDRDSEWQTQFQAMTAKLEKLDQTLSSIVTKLENPTKPEMESTPPKESNAQEAVLEIDSGESDQRETKQKTRGRNPKRLRLQKLATNRR